jgi:hypothetical protein
MSPFLGRRVTQEPAETAVASRFASIDATYSAEVLCFQ